MTQPSSASLLTVLRSLEPLLNKDAKKDVQALIDLSTSCHTDSVSEALKPFLEFQKKFRKTPEGLILRLGDFFENTPSSFGEPDTVETLVAAFRKATATTIKQIAKKFDVNFKSKADAELFENWLRTGVKPPTLEDELLSKIAPLAQQAVDLRDKDLDRLDQDTIQEIMAIVESIKKEDKIDGLRVFMRLFDMEPTGKTAAALVKEIRESLKQYALNRFKRRDVEQLVNA